MELNLNEINAILEEFKNKEDEIKKNIYELEVHKNMVEQNLEQQKQVIQQQFQTTDIEQLQQIKLQYQNELKSKIEEIQKFLGEE